MDLLLDFIGFFLNDDHVVECRNEAEMWKEDTKRKADRIVEAEIEIENETDPIIKRKMKARFALGVTDFSDLKNK